MGADSWLAKKAQHESRVDPWITPHLERRSRGLSHPAKTSSSPPTASPLRLGVEGTAEVVRSHRISCTHYAFRFFTPAGASAQTPYSRVV